MLVLRNSCTDLYLLRLIQIYRQWRGRLSVLVTVADGDDGLHPRLTGGPFGEIAHLVGVVPVQILQKKIKVKLAVPGFAQPGKP